MVDVEEVERHARSERNRREAGVRLSECVDVETLRRFFASLPADRQERVLVHATGGVRLLLTGETEGTQR